MALSGTLETFSLPDVLRLLASTKKTGLLALQGDRGTGRLWVEDGDLVAAEADQTGPADLEGTLFELLRFVDAGFEFQAGVEPVDRDEPRAIDGALDAAQERLAEWREIESVVPSLDVWVRMVPEVDDAVTVRPDQWRVLASVGTGLSGRGLARYLERGEFDVCRQLRDLVEAGMVEIDDVPADAPAARWAPAVDTSSHAIAGDEPTFVEPALSSHEVSSLGADLASFVAAGVADEPVDVVADAAEVTDGDEIDVEADASVADGPVDDPFAAFEPTTDDPVQPTTDAAEAPADQDDEDDDFLAQLSHLSPKAAAAIEAVSTPGVDAGPQPTVDVDDVGHDDAETSEADGGARREDIDQNLLLRFLSSAKP